MPYSSRWCPVETTSIFRVQKKSLANRKVDGCPLFSKKFLNSVSIISWIDYFVNQTASMIALLNASTSTVNNALQLLFIPSELFCLIF
jgi:hypothetical protein